MCFTQHPESVKVVYLLLRFLLCNWSAHVTLFWLFWSRCWQLPSHRHQLYADPTKWDYVFRNFEASVVVTGLHTNWHKTKILGVTARTVHIDNEAVQSNQVYILGLWFRLWWLLLRQTSFIIWSENTYALLPPLTGSARRVVHEEIGCNKWKKTLAYLWVLRGSRARIVWCGGRYNPQQVTG